MSLEACDCGSQIPEDASFCPGCGKPLTEEARESERQANAFPAARPAPDEEGDRVDSITFGTPGALRSCYWSAAFAAIFMSLPLASLLCFIVYPAAGFYSVHSFRRQTQRDVGLRAGAKLGFLTGIITFALMLVLMTIVAVMPGAPGIQGMLDEVEQGFIEQSQPELAEQMREMRESPAAMGLFTLFVLGFSFCLTTSFTTAGGALGAKILEKE